jgi:hypothetical protein
MQIFSQFDIIYMMHIITVFRVVVCFHRGYKGTLKDLDPVSVIAEAENKSSTRSYQTESGETTIPHFRYQEAESWRGPFGDCSEMPSLEKDYCKPDEHHCTWCFQSPNNCTDLNDPCVVLILCSSNVPSRAFTWI